MRNSKAFTLIELIVGIGLQIPASGLRPCPQ